MAGTNNPRPKHRPAGMANPPEQQGQQQATEREELTEQQARNFIWTREGKRRIRLHSPRRIATSIDEAVVRTVGGAPDMRIAENRLAFMADPSKKKNGEEDSRFLENRPDLLAIHASRGETFPNLLFDEDGNVQHAGEEVNGAVNGAAQ